MDIIEERGTTPYSDSVCPVVPAFVITRIRFNWWYKTSATSSVSRCAERENKQKKIKNWLKINEIKSLKTEKVLEKSWNFVF